MTYMSPVQWLRINQEITYILLILLKIEGLEWMVNQKGRKKKKGAAVLNKQQDYLMEMQWCFLEPRCE